MEPLNTVRGSRIYQSIGLIGTAVWIICIVVYLVLKGVNPFGLEPNELGDFVAGALGPLGILWIVLGFWQQGDELRNSVDALQLQGRELRAAVDQQKELVAVTRKQVDADLSAQEESREARRIAASPNFTVSPSGGTISGEKIKSTVNVVNLGADCTDVRFDSAESGALRRHPLFKSGHQDRFAIEHPSSSDWEMLITFTYRNTSNETGTQSFKLKSAGEGMVGFLVEKIVE